MPKIDAVARGPAGPNMNAKRDIYTDAYKLLAPMRIPSPVLVDGGACVGSITKLFLRAWPNSRVCAFEASRDLVVQLCKQYGKNPRVTVHDKALSNKDGKIKFNITEYIGTASILKPSLQSKKFNGSKVSIVKTVQVDCTRLDTILPHVDMLKLDVQGSEIKALEGSVKLFDKIKLILVEVMFYAAYDNEPLFCDINSFLDKNDFQLFNIYNMSTNETGKLTFGEALYINNRFYNKY